MQLLRALALHGSGVTMRVTTGYVLRLTDNPMFYWAGGDIGDGNQYVLKDCAKRFPSKLSAKYYRDRLGEAWSRGLEVVRLYRRTRTDPAPKTSHCIELTRKQVEERVENLARKELGVSAKEAFARFDAGEFAGTALEVEFKMYRHLLGDAT